MKTSEQIDKIAEALAKAQAKFDPVLKNKTNPHFRSKYADLDSTLAAVTPALNANGIAMVQGANLREGLLMVETRLVHSSGQWIADEIAMEPRDHSPQAIGSVMTYGRRYLAASLCGVASEDDDDAESAQHSRPAPHTPHAQKQENLWRGRALRKLDDTLTEFKLSGADEATAAKRRELLTEIFGDCGRKAIESMAPDKIEQNTAALRARLEKSGDDLPGWAGGEEEKRAG